MTIVTRSEIHFHPMILYRAPMDGMLSPCSLIVSILCQLLNFIFAPFRVALNHSQNERRQRHGRRRGRTADPATGCRFSRGFGSQPTTRHPRLQAVWYSQDIRPIPSIWLRELSLSRHGMYSLKEKLSSK